MARIRSIKPELLSDEKTAGLDDSAWRLFVSLLLLADDYGNLRANAKQIEGMVFWGAGPRDVERLMTSLVACGLVRPYTVRGQSYAAIAGWAKHQRVDHPGISLIPTEGHAAQEAITHTYSESSRGSRETLAESPRASRLIGSDLIGSERIRDRDEKRPAAVRAKVKPQSDPRTGQVFGWFRSAWEAVYGPGWVPEPGINKNVAAMLAGLDSLPDPAVEVAKLPEAMSRFVADRAPFVVAARHPLRLFCSDLNKYRLASAPKLEAPSKYRDL